MKVVACKKKGVGVMYFICAFLGVIFLIFGLTTVNVPPIIFGAIITLVCSYVFLQYLFTPECIIAIDEENDLHLPKGVKVNIKDVLDVSYKRASGRGIQYKWGTVILTTGLNTYEYDYIADCENVAKMLTDLMYKAKYKEVKE